MVSYLKRQGDAITCVTQAVDESPTAGSPTPDIHGTETHRRSTKRTGRPSILYGSGVPIGMVTKFIPMDSQSIAVGSTTSGHICKQSKSQVKRLHLPVSRPTGSGDRRVELCLATQGTVCVSTDLYHSAIPSTYVVDNKAISYKHFILPLGYLYEFMLSLETVLTVHVLCSLPMHGNGIHHN